MAEVAILAIPGKANADRAALRMMLEYVESECRRIGAIEAAQHAAKAAASICETGSVPVELLVAPLH
ncbi:MAG: hypothetical protein JWO26_2560 [Rhodospirillales bacterium]|jgi:hypothetical protein|nr:hypothetical protein [Rhodospirillales bacterium]MDB5382928.1 hypothetical protein [Rhodospirillales bacterium]